MEAGEGVAAGQPGVLPWSQGVRLHREEELNPVDPRTSAHPPRAEPRTQCPAAPAAGTGSNGGSSTGATPGSSQVPSASNSRSSCGFHSEQTVYGITECSELEGSHRDHECSCSVNGPSRDQTISTML